MNSQRFFANGKLLISGEYLVLKGARALAIPTKLGQHLEVIPADSGFRWTSKDYDGSVWLDVTFDKKFAILSASENSRARFLQILLQSARKIYGKKIAPCTLTSTLEFDRSWGLGSSSTLTHLIAQWLGIDPFSLFFETQNGSGYDMACAGSSKPLIYELHNGAPSFHSVELPAVFDDVFFIHLQKKQRSDIEVERFNALNINQSGIEEISDITDAFLNAESHSEIMSLMDKHENIMSGILEKPSVKEVLFKEFKGSVKSLGAWGGDFIMALGEDTPDYFKNKGYVTILSMKEIRR